MDFPQKFAQAKPRDGVARQALFLLKKTLRGKI